VAVFASRAFAAEQRNLAGRGKVRERSTNGNRLGQLKLPGINACKAGMIAAPRCGPAIGGCSRRPEMAVFDTGLPHSTGERSLWKNRAAARAAALAH
jgi:hypothetical protein